MAAIEIDTTSQTSPTTEQSNTVSQLTELQGLAVINAQLEEIASRVHHVGASGTEEQPSSSQKKRKDRDEDDEKLVTKRIHDKTPHCWACLYDWEFSHRFGCPHESKNAFLTWGCPACDSGFGCHIARCKHSDHYNGD